MRSCLIPGIIINNTEKLYLCQTIFVIIEKVLSSISLRKKSLLQQFLSSKKVALVNILYVKVDCDRLFAVILLLNQQ